MIPRILLQTSVHPLPVHVQEQWKRRTTDEWQTFWFDDAGIFKYFEDNPLPEFPNIKEVFLSFERGAHRADLFRYYFLYHNGGIFIDSDAMAEVSLDYFIRDNVDYVFVISDLPINDIRGDHPSIFNGMMGCPPRSPLIYDLLVDAYNTKPEALRDYYLLFLHRMFDIVLHKHKPTRALYCYERLDGLQSDIIHNNTTVAKHYFHTKQIP